jgi:hypothetical protein
MVLFLSFEQSGKGARLIISLSPELPNADM